MFLEWIKGKRTVSTALFLAFIFTIFYTSGLKAEDKMSNNSNTPTTKEAIGKESSEESSDSLYIDNTADSSQKILENQSVPFNGNAVTTGSAIIYTPTTNDTFVLANPGFYSVRFYAYTDPRSLLGGFQFELNGDLIGTPVSLKVEGKVLSVEQSFVVKEPNSIFRVVQIGKLGLELSSGHNAHIQILRIGSSS